MDLWSLSPEIEIFNTLPTARQDEIIDIIISTPAKDSYQLESVVRDLMAKLQAPDRISKIFTHYLATQCKNYGYTDNALTIVKKAYNTLDKQTVKDLIIKCKTPHIIRTLLSLDNLSVEEEEQGLRALSNSKYVADFIYEKQYKPSLGAVKALPTVMRLRILENLLTNPHISYNIFENFDADEFKALMFSATFKYLDRARAVVDKYIELQNHGTEGTVVIKTQCENCGEFSITIKSMRIHTPTGLGITNLGGWIMGNTCVLCGRWGHQNKQIICEDDDK